MSALVRLAAVLAVSTALACGRAHRPGALPPTSAETARPEADPVYRGAPQGMRARDGADQVVLAQVAVAPPLALEVREIAGPDVTVSQRVELRRAFPECVWAPSFTPAGAESWTVRIVRGDAGR